MNRVGYSIAPSNADKTAKSKANYITERVGGDRAVAEASLHILEKFFVPYSVNKLPNDQISVKWAIIHHRLKSFTKNKRLTFLGVGPMSVNCRCHNRTFK